MRIAIAMVAFSSVSLLAANDVALEARSCSSAVLQDLVAGVADNSANADTVALQSFPRTSLSPVWADEVTAVSIGDIDVDGVDVTNKAVATDSPPLSEALPEVAEEAQVAQPLTTNLLFPFVTNQAGFDTGIAIANTAPDPFARDEIYILLDEQDILEWLGPSPAPVLPLALDVKHNDPVVVVEAMSASAFVPYSHPAWS